MQGFEPHHKSNSRWIKELNLKNQIFSQLQWFSNFREHQKHLKVLLKHQQGGSQPQSCEPISPRWDLSVGVSNKVPGEADSPKPQNLTLETAGCDLNGELLHFKQRKKLQTAK